MSHDLKKLVLSVEALAQIYARTKVDALTTLSDRLMASLTIADTHPIPFLEALLYAVLEPAAAPLESVE